jgi:hypothetical protein
MLSVFEFQARKIERMAASLAHFVATTAPDRLDWSPIVDDQSETRSAMAMVGECVGVNLYTAALLRGEAAPPVPGHEGNPQPTFAGSGDAVQQLISSGQKLAAAVRDLDDESLSRPYPHWRGPILGEVIIEVAYRNMAYHAGQINMIQLLTGDTEFHVPPSWL